MARNPASNLRVDILIRRSDLARPTLPGCVGPGCGLDVLLARAGYASFSGRSEGRPSTSR